MPAVPRTDMFRTLRVNTFACTLYATRAKCRHVNLDWPYAERQIWSILRIRFRNCQYLGQSFFSLVSFAFSPRYQYLHPVTRIWSPSEQHIHTYIHTRAPRDSVARYHTRTYHRILDLSHLSRCGNWQESFTVPVIHETPIWWILRFSARHPSVSRGAKGRGVGAVRVSRDGSLRMSFDTCHWLRAPDVVKSRRAEQEWRRWERGNDLAKSMARATERRTDVCVQQKGYTTSRCPMSWMKFAACCR